MSELLAQAWRRPPAGSFQRGLIAMPASWLVALVVAATAALLAAPWVRRYRRSRRA